MGRKLKHFEVEFQCGLSARIEIKSVQNIKYMIGFIHISGIEG